MTTHTPLDTLTALRPATPTLDETWSTQTLARITADDTTSLTRRRPRRIARVAVGVAGLAVVGAGAAAAAGVLPQQSFTDAFAGWAQTAPDPDPGHQEVDPSGAQRVASAPGPGGTRFTLVAADGTDGFACVAALFETPASAAEAQPTDFVDANGSMCDALPADVAFGDFAAGDVQRLPRLLDEPEVSVVSAAAGEATRAVLRTADGTSHPVRLVEGRFYSWYAGEPDGTTFLIGFDADGNRVGRVSL